MSIEIKHWDGHVLYTAASAQDVRAAVVEAVAKGAYLQGVYLQGADLQGAYLQGAYLQGVYLRGADLRGADLRGADLQGAYLQGVYLRGVYLQGAKNINPFLTSPLHLLADQPGKIRLYKLVDAEGMSPIQAAGKLKYEKGKTVEVANANTDPTVDCAAGVNVASLDWCLREWKPGFRILVVEFTAADIACIPHGTDGKLRVRKVKVVGEKDLSEIGQGIVPEPEPAATAP